MEEQLKLVHKVIDVVDSPKTSYAQVRLFGRKREEDKLQQIVSVNYKLNEFYILLRS